MAPEGTDHLTLWNLGPQQLCVDFQGGRIVSDAGLLAVRALERPLRVIADLAAQLPDPRSPKFIRHSVEAILTQEVYALLAGYPDHNDADELRTDPLFQSLADVSPDADQPLASGSTLARFAYAFTRRQAELPLEDRPVLREVRAAQTQRLKLLNRYLVDLFVRTRAQPPAELILDVDATDDPTHGAQALSGYHGYNRQHQFLPLHVYEGHSGFPLAVWLRPGTIHASLGAVDILQTIVTALRAAWPEVRLLVRADNGLGVPAVYDFCEAEHLDYVLGYATNPVLERATAQALADVELYYRLYGYRDPHVQRFKEMRDYQAGTWPHARRVIAKVEINPAGSQRRFVVTNRPEPPTVIYRELYVPRGAVPEQPIGEMKNGLRCDRLSACGFCANAFRLLVHALAYAVVGLFREAAAGVEEVATAAVGTLRQRSPGVGALMTEMPGMSRAASRGLSRKFSTLAPPIRWMSPGGTAGRVTGGTVTSSATAAALVAPQRTPETPLDHYRRTLLLADEVGVELLDLRVEQDDFPGAPQVEDHEPNTFDRNQNSPLFQPALVDRLPRWLPQLRFIDRRDQPKRPRAGLRLRTFGLFGLIPAAPMDPRRRCPPPFRFRAREQQS